MENGSDVENENPKKAINDNQSQPNILENHIETALNYAGNFEVKKAVEELKKCKKYLDKLERIDEFWKIYNKVGKVVVDKIIQETEKKIEFEAKIWEKELMKRREELVRREVMTRAQLPATSEEIRVTAEVPYIAEKIESGLLVPFIRIFLDFLEDTKDFFSVSQTKPWLFVKERGLEPPKYLQQCLLFEYFATSIFTLIDTYIESVKIIVISQLERHLYEKLAVEVYSKLILNHFPNLFSEYFTEQVASSYITAAQHPYFLFSDPWELVKIALEFFRKESDSMKIGEITEKFLEIFERNHQNKYCGEILQFQAEFLEDIAEDKQKKETPEYLGKERYLWMAAIGFKKASLYFKEVNITQRYKETQEKSSSIFRDLSQKKEDYMFSIRPLTYEETATNLYVDTGFEDELRGIIDLTDGGNYAVIGPRGSGKSTVINKILMEYEKKKDFLTIRLEAPHRYDTLEFFQFFYLKLAKKAEQKMRLKIPYVLKTILSIETALKKISLFFILLFLLVFIIVTFGYDIPFADLYSWIINTLSHIINLPIIILLTVCMTVFLVVYILSKNKGVCTEKAFFLAAAAVLLFLFIKEQEINLVLIEILHEVGLFVAGFFLLSFLVIVISSAVLFPYMLLDSLLLDKSLHKFQRFSYFMLFLLSAVFIVFSYLKVGWFGTVIHINQASEVFFLIFLGSAYFAFLYKYARKRNYPILIFGAPSLLLLIASGLGILQSNTVALVVGSSCLFLLIIGTLSLCSTLRSSVLASYNPPGRAPYDISFVFLFMLSLFIYRWWPGSILDFMGPATAICFFFLAIYTTYYLLRELITQQKVGDQKDIVFLLPCLILTALAIGFFNIGALVYERVTGGCKAYFYWMDPLFSPKVPFLTLKNYFHSFLISKFFGLAVLIIIISVLFLIRHIIRKESRFLSEAKKIISDLSYLTAIHEESSLGLSSFVPFASRLRGITTQKREYTLPSISEKIRSFITESTKIFRDGVLIVVDEIDKMKSEDALEFLNDLRGIISIKRAYFFLVSPSTFYDEFIKGIMAIGEKESPDSAIDEIIEIKLDDGDDMIRKLLKRRLSRRGIDNLEEGVINGIAILSKGIPRDAVRHLNTLFREWIIRGEKPNITVEDLIRHAFLPQVKELCGNEEKSKQACDEVELCYSRLRENENIRKTLENVNSQEMRRLKSLIRNLREYDFSLL